MLAVLFDSNGFDLTSILFSLGSLYTLWKLAKHRQSFWDRTITFDDYILAQQVAFFLCIPTAVLIHELGHVLATWQVGGQVLEFQWRGFWGYIVPYGTFSQLEFWWIALAGNLASLVLAIAALLVGWTIQRHILGQVLTSFALLEFIFSMVLYPLMSFAIPDFTGDWVRIYQFSVAPYAQIVLIVHLMAIAIFSKLQRPIRIRAMKQVELPPQFEHQAKPTEER